MASTALTVCYNRRIARHCVFRDPASPLGHPCAAQAGEPLLLHDTVLLRRRALIETVGDHKHPLQVEHTRHHRPTNVADNRTSRRSTGEESMALRQGLPSTWNEIHGMLHFPDAG